MADFMIALGGTISACTTDEVSGMLDQTKRDILAGNAKPRRIMRPVSAAATSATATLPANTCDTFQLAVGRPSAGRLWVVTRVVVLAEDDHSTHTSLVAALYVGDPMNIGLSQCVTHGVSIPWTTTENENAYVVHDRETLFVNFTATGSTTATQLVVNALAWEYKDSDVDAQVI